MIEKRIPTSQIEKSKKDLPTIYFSSNEEDERINDEHDEEIEKILKGNEIEINRNLNSFRCDDLYLPQLSINVG